MGSSVIQAFQALLVHSRSCSLQSSHLSEFDMLAPTQAEDRELSSAAKHTLWHNKSPTVNKTHVNNSDRRRQKPATRIQAATPLESGTKWR